MFQEGNQVYCFVERKNKEVCVFAGPKISFKTDYCGKMPNFSIFLFRDDTGMLLFCVPEKAVMSVFAFDRNWETY